MVQPESDSEVVVLMKEAKGLVVSLLLTFGIVALVYQSEWKLEKSIVCTIRTR